MLLKKTIAAIVPLYNGADYITRSLQSILDQTRPADEIIIVDDGSTDDGAAVARRVAAGHDAVRFLSKINGGQSSARNTGVAATACDLVAFLDQDDAWYPQHLEELARPFEEDASRFGLGWVYSDLDEVDRDFKMVRRRTLRGNAGQHPKLDLTDCLENNLFILPSASLIDRQAFLAVGGFDEALVGYEDDDLFLRLFREGYDNVFLDRALTVWRLYHQSTSFSARMGVSRMIYWRKLVATFGDGPHNTGLWKHMISNRFLRLVFGEYERALAAGNVERFEARSRDLAELLAQQSGRRLRIFRALLPWLSNYAVARQVSRRKLGRRMFAWLTEQFSQPS